MDYIRNLEKKIIIIAFLLLIIFLTIFRKNSVPLSSNGIDSIVAKYNLGIFGEELFYLTSMNWGPCLDFTVTVTDENVTLTCYQPTGRIKTRSLSKDEWTKFMNFISENEIDTLEDWDPDTYIVCDGVRHQYLHCTSGNTKTIYMDNPDITVDSKLYASLVNLFKELTYTGDFSITYKADGVKVLIPNEDHQIISVWKENDDFRVLVNESEGLKWRSFDGTMVGDIVPEPDIMTPQNVWNSYFVCSQRDLDTKSSGLWLTQENATPILIAEGSYASPIVIPGTDWVVCAKAENGWAYPNEIVRINLNTFEEITLDIKPADYLEPLVSINGSVLIVRSEKGSYNAKHYLYDVKTDSIHSVKGDFSGLSDVSERFLQATTTPGEFYTVQFNNSYRPAVIGKLNVETFKFTPMAEFKGISFKSMNMWIDEDNPKLYVVANKDLLELALP